MPIIILAMVVRKLAAVVFCTASIFFYKGNSKEVECAGTGVHRKRKTATVFCIVTRVIQVAPYTIHNTGGKLEDRAA